MSHRSASKITLTLLIVTVLALTGCATSLPPTMVLAGEEPQVPGAVVALTGNGERIVMANIEGVYLKDGEGEWEPLEVPGLSQPAGITCIALDGDEVAIGTEKEGMYLFSDDVWETRNRKYGGLPDDSVAAIAFEGEDEGLTGRALWVATQSGISVRRDGMWSDFSPGRQWVASMAEKADVGYDSNIYVGSGFHLGTSGEDSQLFKPPVTTIAFREEMVILGNGAQRLAMINETSVALFRFVDGFTVTDLLTDGGTVWTGSNGGFWWGRHLDSLSGRPWPTNRGHITWRGTLFGNRDSRPFM